MSYLTVPLNTEHIKQQFACGNELLDNYLHTQAKQDVKRKLSVCFVATNEANLVKGYYTLSNTAIGRDQLPNEIIRKLPPAYINLPATLLGRLAVDNQYKGQGLGEMLLVDAVKRCYYTALHSIASMAVLVDPIDDSAIRFYTKYGFILLDSGKMFLPMATVASLFS